MSKRHWTTVLMDEIEDGDRRTKPRRTTFRSAHRLMSAWAKLDRATARMGSFFR